MEVIKSWKNNDINKYYIISLDKKTNEWKFFKEIVGHTVLWKDEPSHYGMTKSKAIEVLNIVKNLTKENIKSENPTKETDTPTEPTTEPETPTNSTEGNKSTEPTNTTPTDTPTEPSESNTDAPTNTDGETPTRENNNGKTASEGNTEPNNTEPTSPVGEPTTPTEPQYKIITISSVTYNSTEVAIFDDVDYNKLKSTLTYIDSTYPNTVVHVVTKSDTGKSIFYFYLEDELTWFLELRTNIDYSLVNHVTTLDNIKELL